MAPVAGNTRVICVAKQTAKGSVAAAPTVWFPLSGDAALNPNREIIQLPETDTSSQRADDVVVGASPGGGWTGWWRDAGALLLAEGIQGTIAAGVATPAQTLPYYTAWDVIPGVMTTRYADVRFSQLTVSGQALQGISYSVEAVALSASLNHAQPTITLPTGQKFAYPHVSVSVGGVTPGTHDSFALTINRNVSILRGDLGLLSYDSWAGTYDVTGQLVRIFENDDAYAQVHGGSAAATALTTTIFSEALAITLTDGTDTVVFDSNAIQYTGIAVPVSVDGSPIMQTLDFATKRQPTATIADNFTITIT